MAPFSAVSLLPFLLILAPIAAGDRLEEAVKMAKSGILEARSTLQTLVVVNNVHGSGQESDQSPVRRQAMEDCENLYGATHDLLDRFVSGEVYEKDDGLTWLSGALAAHRTCLDGLVETGFTGYGMVSGQNLTDLLGQALSTFKGGSGRVVKGERVKSMPGDTSSEGLLASWSLSNWNADFVVAKDGSGTHTTINDAVTAMSQMGKNRPERLTVYVKAGVYYENVEIGSDLKNVMLVGEGIDKTIISGSKNVPDGSTTYSSATFGVSGDGFWAKDVTFENTAGPHKHQAVALRVNSDLSVFYKCSMKGYQDTLFTHSLRQFYRDCDIYGTIDFIFGDAITVIQNCNIYIRKPMRGQANIITAQGRDHPDSNTGISIHACKVIPSAELLATKNEHKNYLGRPWKRYSRTVFMKSDLDGLIDPKGWDEWSGEFGLSTLYYGEYMNTGAGANTDGRVKWPGFHVMGSSEEAYSFGVSEFLHGEWWIAASGVPFWTGV